jgi:hypothetical protein
VGGTGAEMTAALLGWCAQLVRDDVTALALAEAVGRVTAGAGTLQLTVHPDEEVWSLAEVITREEGAGPSYVRLVPATAGDLTVRELEARLGPPAILPPKVHFDDPELRVYLVDDGQTAHTAAVIAELPAGGGETVGAVVLRRDVRP